MWFFERKTYLEHDCACCPLLILLSVLIRSSPKLSNTSTLSIRSHLITKSMVRVLAGMKSNTPLLISNYPKVFHAKSSF